MSGRVAAFLRSITDGAAAVVGAATCSQAPEFVQQYMQRLGGHRDEAYRFVAMLKAQGVDSSAALLANAEARATALAQSLDAIMAAGPFAGPIALLRHMDHDIARATLRAFQPAVPLTPQGLVYSAVGLILGIVILKLIAAPFTWLWRRRIRA